MVDVDAVIARLESTDEDMDALVPQFEAELGQEGMAKLAVWFTKITQGMSPASAGFLAFSLGWISHDLEQAKRKAPAIPPGMQAALDAAKKGDANGEGPG